MNTEVIFAESVWWNKLLPEPFFQTHFCSWSSTGHDCRWMPIMFFKLDPILHSIYNSITYQNNRSWLWFARSQYPKNICWIIFSFVWIGTVAGGTSLIRNTLIITQPDFEFSLTLLVYNDVNIESISCLWIVTMQPLQIPSENQSCGRAILLSSCFPWLCELLMMSVSCTCAVSLIPSSMAITPYDLIKLCIEWLGPNYLERANKSSV